MNEGMWDAKGHVLWAVEPEGAGPYGGGSIRVPSYQIGIIVKDGEVVEVVLPSRRHARVPKGGEGRAYFASSLQFSVAFSLNDLTEATQPGEDVALDWKGLTVYGKLVTGRIELTLRVVPDKGSVKGLLQLLPRDGGPVTKWEVAGALKEEVQKNVTLMILGCAEDGLQEIGESLKARLESKVRGYGLCLDGVHAALEAKDMSPFAKPSIASGTDGEDTIVSSLHEAARRGDTDKVLSLVSAGADVDAAREDIVGFASTALHKAASEGHTETVLALVSAGADINIQSKLKWSDKLSQTPLHEAVSRGHTETVLALVKAGANVDVSDEVGCFTPLHRAVQRDDLEMVLAFISAGADLDAMSEVGSSLHWAVWWGNAGVMRALIDAGADVDARDEYGGTPLHVAVLSFSSSPEEAVRTLVDAGADVNARRSVGGETPLHGAALDCRAEVARALVDAGADVNARDDYDKTPLHKAAGQGDTDSVRALITAGADVNARSEGGEVDDEDEIAHWRRTAYWRREDVTVRSEGGVTALHWAALMGHTETTRALISEGAEVDARNEEGQTALHWAALRGHKETVQALVSAGADVNTRDKEGFTPSFLAAVEEDEETARELDDIAKGERDEPPLEAEPPARRPQPPDAPATPSYWVYDDKETGSACIHEGACSFCNHGEGMGHGRIPSGSEWHGPYASRTEAFRGARKTGRREVRGCGICRP